jgi:phosphate transport system substrate-binding protein
MKVMEVFPMKIESNSGNGARRKAAALTIGLVALAMNACGGGRLAPQAETGVRPGASVKIQGAGATFPYPIYSQWAHAYEEKSGVQVNYQSIGSGGGIAQIKAATVDFGASDAPLLKEELDSAGLVQFPLVIGGVVPVVHIDGVAAGQLKLSSDVLAKIFLGKIHVWNDPAIKAENPDLDLPAKEITVVHRADGSGTTWIFTSYLAAVSPEWKSRVGAEKSVAWPVGVGGKGNEGVAQYVERVNGAIGYVEYAYALQNKMSHALLRNRDGAYVAPTIESFQAAAANADWANAPGFYLVLIDQPGAATWPITGASFILLHREQADAAKARAMLEFFDWSYCSGADAAAALHYVPIPASVYDLVETAWTNELRASGSPVWKSTN